MKAGVMTSGFRCFVEARLNTGESVYSVSVDLLLEVLPLYQHLLACTMVEHVQIVCEDTGEVLRGADSHTVLEAARSPEPLRLPREPG